MRSRSPKWLFVLVVSVFMVGCWDYEEIEDRALVAAVGVDKDEKDGQYIYSIQVPIPTKIVSGSGEGGGGGGKDGNAVEVYSTKANSYLGAAAQFRHLVSKNLFFGYTQIIVISEEVARDGIDQVMDVFMRNPDIRLDLWPIVVKGKAMDVLKMSNPVEEVPILFLKEMLQQGKKEKHMPDEDLGDFLLNRFQPTGQQAITSYYQMEDEKPVWSGIALFDHGKMVGTLSPKETTALLQIRDGELGEILEAPCANYRGNIGFRPLGIKKKVRFRDPLSIEIEISVRGSLLEKNCHVDLHDAKVLNQLEQAIAKEYMKYAKQMLHKIQKEYKVDVLLLGRYLYAYHPQKWKTIKWHEQFPHVPLNLRYQVQIIQFGVVPK